MSDPDDQDRVNARHAVERLVGSRPVKPWAVITVTGGLLQGLYEDESRARLEMRGMADRSPGTAYMACQLLPEWIALATVGPLVEVPATRDDPCAP